MSEEKYGMYDPKNKEPLTISDSPDLTPIFNKNLATLNESTKIVIENSIKDTRESIASLFDIRTNWNTDKEKSKISQTDDLRTSVTMEYTYKNKKNVDVSMNSVDELKGMVSTPYFDGAVIIDRYVPVDINNLKNVLVQPSALNSYNIEANGANSPLTISKTKDYIQINTTWYWIRVYNNWQKYLVSDKGVEMPFSKLELEAWVGWGFYKDWIVSGSPIIANVNMFDYITIEKLLTDGVMTDDFKNELEKWELAKFDPIAQKISNILKAIDGFNPKDSTTLPTKVLGNMYVWKSINEKIWIARILAQYLNDQTYNNNFVKKWWDVDNNKIWESAQKEDKSWWVCRQIHSEVANFLYEAGEKTVWIIDTNAEGNHTVTWLKNWDNFYIIDYGDQYQSKDPKKLKEKYLAQKWGLDLKEQVYDKDGNSLWFIQTSLETWYERIVSAWGENEGFDVSVKTAQDWIKSILKWTDVKANVWNDGSVLASINKWNGKIQWWVTYEVNIEPNYARAQNISWEFWFKNKWFFMGNKIGYTDATFIENWKEFSSVNYWLQAWYVWNKDISKRVNIWWSVVYRWNVAKYTKWSDGLDSTQDITSVVSANIKLNENIATNIYWWMWADLWWNNGRSCDNFTTPYEKFVAWWNMTINSWKYNYIKVGWEYISKHWEETKKVEIEGKYDKTTLSWLFKITDPTTNQFLLSESTIKAGLKYKITDSLEFNVSWEQTINTVSKDTKWTIWFTQSF